MIFYVNIKNKNIKEKRILFNKLLKYIYYFFKIDLLEKKSLVTLFTIYLQKTNKYNY